MKKLKLSSLFLLSFLGLQGCSNTTLEKFFSSGETEKKEIQTADSPTVKEEISPSEEVTEVNVITDPNTTSVGKGDLTEKEKVLKNFCDKTEASFKQYGWGKSDCHNEAWHFVRTSVNGFPLVWKSYGDAVAVKGKTETTLIMCGVHGDEITPIKFCFDVINYLDEVEKGRVVDPHNGKLAQLRGKKVIVAPLVNPDSYFKSRPTRTNANGVDVNRNFPTKDFDTLAYKRWVDHYSKDKRRFPGEKPMSEPETVFQVNLIYRYQPDKIISVHSPLTMLDYDGPASAHTGGIVGSRANQLLIRMSEEAKGYRIKNYPFFPGSLGNYAGNERNIPTYTLELPTSDPRKSDEYWKLFKGSIHSAVMHEIQGEGFAALHSKTHSHESEGQSANN